MVMTSLGLPVCASSLRMSPFRLLSSMKPQDDVNENTSYFQAEVNRLRALMDVVESGENCFLLLDEILRGTNSEDKRNGTRGFLKRLQVHPIKGVLATHDVDIAEMAHANAAFKNYYFESGYDGKKLTFDYRLRQGVCASPNATQLLKLNNLID
jgi:DNA mismatch repair ATPase MutS